MLGLLYVVVSLDAHAAWLSFNIQNEDSQSFPCRIHLFDSDGKPQRAAGLPFWHDHLYFKHWDSHPSFDWQCVGSAE